jgi:hypothetical protein
MPPTGSSEAAGCGLAHPEPTSFVAAMARTAVDVLGTTVWRTTLVDLPLRGGRRPRAVRG